MFVLYRVDMTLDCSQNVERYGCNLHFKRRQRVTAPTPADRLDTDVMLAVNSGMDSVCVLSGVARLHDIRAQDERGRPTYIMSHLGLLAELLGNNCEF
jgi:hypothetical protein